MLLTLKLTQQMQTKDRKNVTPTQVPGNLICGDGRKNSIGSVCNRSLYSWSYSDQDQVSTVEKSILFRVICR